MEFTELIHARIKRVLGGGPTLLDVSFKNQFDWVVTCDDFVLDLVARELCFMSIIYVLTPFHDSVLSFVD